MNDGRRLGCIRFKTGRRGSEAPVAAGLVPSANIRSRRILAPGIEFIDSNSPSLIGRTVIAKLIDVWNVATFDADLTAKLGADADLIRNSMMTDRKIDLEREASNHKGPYRDNPYRGNFLKLVEEIGREMEARTIRAWHYTRLTDAEIDKIRANGVHPSTLESLRLRLDAMVTAGLFTAETADALFAASPFHEQLDVRSNRFWMTSHPLAIDDSSVTSLLGNWGGESVYFWLQDAALQEMVASIGVPRVLEISVPLNATCRAYWAGQAVVSTFGRALGYRTDHAFDLYCIRDLGPESVIAAHSEGGPAFTTLARGYPPEFSAVA
jgi:hypothetical protein